MTEEKKFTGTMRVMTEADIPFGMKLKNITKWNQLPADWKRFIDLEPKGMFIAVDENGEDVGTVSTTAYGTKLAWIGMVLVPPEKRRMGIGTALLKASMQYCVDKKIEVVGLDATPMGNKLYLTLGFSCDFALERRQGVGQTFLSATPKGQAGMPVLPSGGVGKLQRSDLDALAAFDAPIFGVPRPNVLKLLYKDYPDLCWVAKSGSPAVGSAKEGGKITGYVMMRPGFNAHQIGPWIAQDAATAEALFKTALSAIPGKPIFFDVVVPNESAMAIAKTYNFELQRPFVRMFLGENKYPADTKKMFAICGVEKG
jgi:GNAT superfamily N-acetyltransferase